jgi:hypothetical protein
MKPRVLQVKWPSADPKCYKSIKRCNRQTLGLVKWSGRRAIHGAVADAVPRLLARLALADRPPRAGLEAIAGELFRPWQCVKAMTDVTDAGALYIRATPCRHARPPTRPSSWPQSWSCRHDRIS